jgi:hypothetical protein
VDIHGSYLSNTSTWMWSVLSMDIQLDIHPLPSLANTMQGQGCRALYVILEKPH